ncbi:hypothetical protein [Halomonas litopenaei]|nr:hypothetical protein [Halomonas litopenaei]
MIVLSLALGVSTHTHALEEHVINAARLAESYTDQVPVSGKALVGVMLAEPGTPSGRNVYVPINDNIDEDVSELRLCLTLNSRDGRYTGHFESSFPATSPPYLMRIEYETQSTQFYSQALAAGLVGLVEVRRDCLHRQQPFPLAVFPLAWSPDYNPRGIDLFINSSRRRSFLRLDDKRVDCQPLGQDQLIAYDSHCRLDFPVNTSETPYNPPPITLVRMLGSNVGPLVSIPLIY